MKGKSIIKLVSVLLLIGILCYVAIFGLTIGSWEILPASQGIKYGLDIAGGSVITYEADADSVSNEQADTVVSILRTRLSGQGYTEANVVRQGEKRFVVEIPDVTNPEEAVALLGTTAKLSFVDADGNEVLSSADIKDAKSEYGQMQQNSAAQYYVTLELEDSGVQKFADATAAAAARASEGKNYISIMLDDEVISSPSVQERIDSNTAVITGGFDAQSAGQLASLIRSGQLPFKLQEVSLNSVGATLGESALSSSVMAALISLILIMIYMIIFYRLPGVVSAIALAFYAVLTVIVLGILGVNLTLPGIAGIILSMGMAVDANVVIFERIIDELKNGKTVGAAVDAGFHRAIVAVVDSNVTTIITSVVLWWLGTGTVKGFAITLLVGVIISMFTAIVVTKFLMKQLIGLNVKNRRLYGIGVH